MIVQFQTPYTDPERHNAQRNWRTDDAGIGDHPVQEYDRIKTD